MLPEGPVLMGSQEICSCYLGRGYCRVPKYLTWSFKALFSHDFRKVLWLPDEEKGESV